MSEGLIVGLYAVYWLAVLVNSMFFGIKNTELSFYTLMLVFCPILNIFSIFRNRAISGTITYFVQKR